MTDDERINEIIDIATRLSKLTQPGNGAYYLRTLLRIKEWAIQQQPVKVGQTVTVTDPDAAAANSYAGFIDVFKSHTGLVVSVGFNGSHNYWSAGVRFDGTKRDPGVFSFPVDALTVLDTPLRETQP